MQSGFDGDFIDRMLKERDENYWIENESISLKTITNLTNLLYNPEVKLPIEELRDCFSKGQLASKLWLINKLNNLQILKPINILIVGGWIGSLAALLFNKYKPVNDTEFTIACYTGNLSHKKQTFRINSITSVDLNKKCEMIAKLLNYDEAFNTNQFKAVTEDMYAIDYNKENYDVIINTSCEHIPNVREWVSKIPPGKIVVAQSNNFYSCDQHVSCVKSEDELEKQLNLFNIEYKGTLHCSQYDRFMVIGKT